MYILCLPHYTGSHLFLKNRQRAEEYVTGIVFNNNPGILQNNSLIFHQLYPHKTVPMLRRKFLQNSLLLASASGINNRLSVNLGKHSTDSDNPLEKAKMALLTMQRNSKEQGMASIAFLNSGDYDLVVLIAFEAIYALTNSPEAEKTQKLADTAPAGEALLYAAQKTDDKNFQETVNSMTSSLLNRDQVAEENIYLYGNNQEVNIETVFYILPFLAAAGFADEAYIRFTALRKLLYDENKHLFNPIYDAGKKEITPTGFWGSGNGLAVTGLTRMLRFIPSGMSEEKEELTDFLKELIDGCLVYLREDGLFHNIIDDTSSFVEVDLSQMLAYAIFSGIYYGYLGFDYRGKADLMRKAVNEKTDTYGFVNDACSLTDRNTSCRSVGAQVFYVLMETAANRLYK